MCCASRKITLTRRVTSIHDVTRRVQVCMTSRAMGSKLLPFLVFLAFSCFRIIGLISNNRIWYRSVVFNLGVATPMGVLRHFSMGRERYLVFVRNPLVADSDVVNVFSGNDATPEEFIALKNDSTAENAFKERSLPAYWSAMIASYSRVISTAIQLLMPFSSTWLCEACFSAISILIAELHQRCALTTTEARIDKLVTKGGNLATWRLGVSFSFGVMKLRCQVSVLVWFHFC